MSKVVSTSDGVGLLDDGPGEQVVCLLDVPQPNLGAAFGAGWSIGDIVAAPVRAMVLRQDLCLLAPIPRPPKVWIVGYGYSSHRSETGHDREQTGAPIIFLTAPSAVIGTGERIKLPREAPAYVDYEGELGVVIGRRATAIAPAEVPDVIAGYTICNDVSARDVQKGQVPGRHAEVSAAKSFDTFSPMGPCLATHEDFADPNDLRLRTWVDGELRQDSRTSLMVHSVPELVSYLSRQTTLEPGDVISTGTPAGVGSVTGQYLRPGSVVTIEIEGIGVLENVCE